MRLSAAEELAGLHVGTSECNGKILPDDVLTTTYDADNNIECGGTTKPAHSVQPGPSTTIPDADARDVADTGLAGT